MEEARSNLATLRTRLSTIDAQMADLQAEAADAQERLPLAQSERQQLQAEVEQLAAQCGEQRAVLSDAQSQQSRTQERSKVLAGLSKAKKQGLLPGIHGRLGDLGAIDAQYDVAVSTACPQLNNIVVDVSWQGGEITVVMGLLVDD